jgi:hypothetical protein
MTPQTIIETLKRYRFDLSTEKNAQQEVGQALAANGIAHQREYTLEKDDRTHSIIDFYIPERALTSATSGRGKEIGIGVELKIGGGPMEVYRQLQRYCRTGKLSAIILVTNHAMGLPPEIEGVPAFYLSLGRAWI